MHRTANVARTAHDLDHVNRLRAPHFGVVQIQLVAMAKKSKSVRLLGAKTVKDPAADGEEAFHFVPSTADKVKIKYEIEDPFECVTKARLEIFRRFKKVAVWKKDLLAAEFAAGEHTLQISGTEDWDGKIGAHADFPDEYLSVQHSPYKLKLMLSGPGRPRAAVAWTYFHILVGEIKLEWGVPEAIPADAPGQPSHRAVLTSLRGQSAQPPDATDVKVFLTSNLFKKTHSMTDNSLYTEYQALWGDGPKIPIFAKVKLKTSADAKVEAPKALGDLKFLWDWESTSAATGQAFVDNAQNYNTDLTKPKGQNCHKDRGGKRADNTKPVFPAQPGYDPQDTLTDGVFPFKVEAVPDNRKWTAVSHLWRDKSLASKTGVIFQPARIAGDKYKLTAYVAHDVDENDKLALDVDADAPLPIDATLKASTSTFIVWRKIHLVKRLKKSATVTDLNLATVFGFYTPAFLELENLSGAVGTVSQGTWNNGIRAAWEAEETDVYWRLMFNESINQYTTGDYGVYYRTRVQFRAARAKKKAEEDWAAVNSALNGPPWLGHLGTALTTALASGPDLNAGGAAAPARAAASAALQPPLDPANADIVAGFAVNAVRAADTALSNAGRNTNAGYARACEVLAKAVLIRFFNNHLAGAEGANIFQVRMAHNLTGDLTNFLDGEAVDFDNGTDRRCGFLSLCDPAEDVPGASADQTAAHEFGHHFFLPHPSGVGTESGYQAHDDAFSDCLMSYSISPRSLCGLCLLRLRGWNKAALSTTSANNTAP
jgi:hypothetical protein